MLDDEFITTGVQLHDFELNIEAKIRDTIVDKTLDKILGLEEIPLEDLLQLYCFNKDDHFPLEPEPSHSEGAKPTVDSFTADTLDK